MTVMFYLFCASVLTEVMVHVLFHYKMARFTFVVMSIVLANFASGSLILMRPNMLTILIGVASLYRAFNMVRIVKGRMHESYLRRATWRTGYLLVGVQILLCAAWWLWYQTEQDRHIAWLVVASAQVLGAMVLIFSLSRRLQKTAPGSYGKHYSDAELPSLTVAIPARNETEDLQYCLESVVSSDYPKLEVIVLDDCSQNKHTPEIIRSFAHAGVRFVQGQEPRPTWLAKNQAYDRLAQESSGEYIVFCGVDVRFEPHSLRALVTLALNKKKSMVSVLPMQQIASKPHTSIVQAMRYWWEIAPPRRLFNRPAVLSSCWLIERKALKKTGGFAAVTRAIVPEAYFAKALVFGDRYSFVRSDKTLLITSFKQRAEQVETAIRMRYPQVHRRPEQVFLVALVEAAFLLLPFMLALFGWWLPITALAQLLAGLASTLLTVCYARMAFATHLNKMPYVLVGLPVMIVVDLILLHRSMWQYEFSEVEWKDRNVCIPVMHTYSKLPEL